MAFSCVFVNVLFLEAISVLVIYLALGVLELSREAGRLSTVEMSSGLVNGINDDLLCGKEEERLPHHLWSLS